MNLASQRRGSKLESEAVDIMMMMNYVHMTNNAKNLTKQKLTLALCSASILVLRKESKLPNQYITLDALYIVQMKNTRTNESKKAIT
jgi:hypothetical protein